MTVSTLLFIVGAVAGASLVGSAWLIVAQRATVRIIATAFIMKSDGAEYVRFDQTLRKDSAALAFMEWFDSFDDPYLVTFSEQPEPKR